MGPLIAMENLLSNKAKISMLTIRDVCNRSKQYRFMRTKKEKKEKRKKNLENKWLKQKVVKMIRPWKYIKFQRSEVRTNLWKNEIFKISILPAYLTDIHRNIMKIKQETVQIQWTPLPKLAILNRAILLFWAQEPAKLSYRKKHKLVLLSWLLNWWKQPCRWMLMAS